MTAPIPRKPPRKELERELQVLNVIIVNQATRLGAIRKVCEKYKHRNGTTADIVAEVIAILEQDYARGRE